MTVPRLLLATHICNWWHCGTGKCRVTRVGATGWWPAASPARSKSRSPRPPTERGGRPGSHPGACSPALLWNHAPRQLRKPKPTVDHTTCGAQTFEGTMLSLHADSGFRFPVSPSGAGMVLVHVDGAFGGFASQEFGLWPWPQTQKLKNWTTEFSGNTPGKLKNWKTEFWGNKPGKLKNWKLNFPETGKGGCSLRSLKIIQFFNCFQFFSFSVSKCIFLMLTTAKKYWTSLGAKYGQNTVNTSTFGERLFFYVFFWGVPYIYIYTFSFHNLLFFGLLEKDRFSKNNPVFSNKVFGYGKLRVNYGKLWVNYVQIMGQKNENHVFLKIPGFLPKTSKKQVFIFQPEKK